MSTDPYVVNVPACRSRQQRLQMEIASLGLQWVILTRAESVQWLTGAYVGTQFKPAAAMNRDGHVTLILPSRSRDLTVAADEVLRYEEKRHSTMVDEQRAASNKVLLDALGKAFTEVGAEWSEFGPDLVAACDGRTINIEPVIFRLRRRKDADELRMMRRANDANRAMYQVAREIIRPGVNELEVYNALHSAAVDELGEPLTYFGQDFRSGARGGPPRNRKIESGELYILDLGVGFRGYYSDNARTIAVGDGPSAKQMEAWNRVADVFSLVESFVRAGASCRQLFHEVQALLDRCIPWVFNHHLGHGVGLAPHEGPHLNPRWDDTFAEGDFFTVEPGLYHEELRQGVRLEENYLVTANSFEKLTDYPLEL